MRSVGNPIHGDVCGAIGHPPQPRHRRFLGMLGVATEGAGTLAHCQQGVLQGILG